MLKFVAENFDEETLDSITGDQLFADTNKGKFVLRRASYEDELAYLVLKLQEDGKLTWSKDKGERFEAKYKGLEIEVGHDLQKYSLVIKLESDENHYVLSNSPLIRTLAHIIWHTLNVPHTHINLSHHMSDYYDQQGKVAKEIMEILKSN